MANQSATFIPSTSHSQVGVSITLPWASEVEKGCGYTGQTNGMHTVQFTTTNNFIGTIEIQGTLASSPTDNDWYTIISYGDGVIPVTDGTSTVNFAGNHVWVRSNVTAFSAGEINRVLFSHN